MDKYEYKVRSDEIKSLIGKGDYAQAVEIADTIDWRRVKSVMMLCTVSDLYKINRRYEDAKNMLLLAYERRPGGRTICYSLCELCIKTEEFVQALNYYKEFVQAAPKDPGRYILQYKLYEAQEVSLEERIGVLEEMKKRDYREKWAYELAYLYHRMGLGTRCVEECDELILWFGEGKYVVKAMELKMLHQPLSPAQQEIYDRRFEEEMHLEEGGQMDGDRGAYGEPAEYGQYPDMGQEGYGWTPDEGQSAGAVQDFARMESGEPTGQADELDIQVKTMDVGKYNTINLQEELAAGLQEVLGADGTAYPPEAAGEQPAAGYIGEEEAYPESEEEEIEESEVFFGATGEIADMLPEDGIPESGEEGFGRMMEETVPEAAEAIGGEPAVATAGETAPEADREGAGGSGMPRPTGARPAGEPGGMAGESPVQEPVGPQSAQEARESGEKQPEPAVHGPVRTVAPREEQARPQEAKGQEQERLELTGHDSVRTVAPWEEQVPPQSAPGARELEQKQPEPAVHAPEQRQSDIERMREEAQPGIGREEMSLDKTAAQVMEQMRAESGEAESGGTSAVQPPKELADVLLQEADGQISMVLPEAAAIEKQITGQMKIEDILVEWERMKKENQEKCEEEVRRRVLRQTGPMFTEFEAAVRDGLLEALEKEAAGKAEAGRKGPIRPEGNEGAMQTGKENGREPEATGRVAEPEHGGAISAAGQLASAAVSKQSARGLEYIEEDAPNHPENLTEGPEGLDEGDRTGWDGAQEALSDRWDADGRPESRGTWEAEVAAESEGTWDAEGLLESEDTWEAEARPESRGTWEADGRSKSRGTWEAEAVEESEGSWDTEAGAESEDTWEVEDLSEPEDTWEAEDLPESEDTWEADGRSKSRGTWEAEAAEESEGSWDTEAGAESKDTWEAEDLSEPEDTWDTEARPESRGTWEAEAAEESEGSWDTEAGAESKDTWEAEDLSEPEDTWGAEARPESRSTWEAEAGAQSEDTWEVEDLSEPEDTWGAEARPESGDSWDEEDAAVSGKLQGDRSRAKAADAPVFEELSGTEDPEAIEESDIIEEIEEMQEQAKETKKRIKSPKAPKASDGSEKPPVEREQAKVRSLSREEKELFAPFIQSRRSREQLVKAIDSLSMAAYTGNLIITGEEGMDMLTLAKNIIRDVRVTDSNFSGKVAKITGQGLNERNVGETLEHLGNGALIVEAASGMTTQTAAALHKSLQQERLGIIVILEDTKKAIKKLLLGTPELYGDFPARVDLEALSNDTLVSYGRQYAREKEYSIDDLGMLALHTRIEELQTIDHVVTVTEVKDIVDEAIRRASRKTLGHFFDVLLARRYDDEDMIVLTEKDFVA